MVHMADRPDPLKVFLGNLAVDVNKPKIWDMMEHLGLAPHDIFVPQVQKNKLGIAFLIFNTVEEAQFALDACKGLVGPASPNGVQAGGTAWEPLDKGSLEIFRVFRN